MRLIKIIVFFVAVCFGLSVYAVPKSMANKSARAKISKEINSSAKGLVNINKATSAELQVVKGIGPKRAQAIEDYRNKNGKFKLLDDLANVKGIGKKRLEKIASYLTV